MTTLNVINEALGEFPQQYALAKEIAKRVINMVKTHDTHIEFAPSTDNKFKMVHADKSSAYLTLLKNATEVLKKMAESKEK